MPQDLEAAELAPPEAPGISFTEAEGYRGRPDKEPLPDEETPRSDTAVHHFSIHEGNAHVMALVSGYDSLAGHQCVEDIASLLPEHLVKPLEDLRDVVEETPGELQEILIQGTRYLNEELLKALKSGEYSAELLLSVITEEKDAAGGTRYFVNTITTGSDIALIVNEEGLVGLANFPEVRGVPEENLRSGDEDSDVLHTITGITKSAVEDDVLQRNLVESGALATTNFSPEKNFRRLEITEAVLNSGPKGIAVVCVSRGMLTSILAENIANTVAGDLDNPQEAVDLLLEGKYIQPDGTEGVSQGPLSDWGIGITRVNLSTVEEEEEPPRVELAEEQQELEELRLKVQELENVIAAKNQILDDQAELITQLMAGREVAAPPPPTPVTPTPEPPVALAEEAEEVAEEEVPFEEVPLTEANIGDIKIAVLAEADDLKLSVPSFSRFVGADAAVVSRYIPAGANFARYLRVFREPSAVERVLADLDQREKALILGQSPAISEPAFSSVTNKFIAMAKDFGTSGNKEKQRLVFEHLDIEPGADRSKTRAIADAFATALTGFVT